MGIDAAGQQHRLIEDHAGISHGRRAAQQRQNDLGEHRLNQEQQRGTEKQSEGVEHQHDDSSLRIQRFIRNSRSIAIEIGGHVGTRRL